MLYKRIYFTHQNIAIFNQIIANSLQSEIKISRRRYYNPSIFHKLIFKHNKNKDFITILVLHYFLKSLYIFAILFGEEYSSPFSLRVTPSPVQHS